MWACNKTEAGWQVGHYTPAGNWIPAGPEALFNGWDEAMCCINTLNGGFTSAESLALEELVSDVDRIAAALAVLVSRGEV